MKAQPSASAEATTPHREQPCTTRSSNCCARVSRWRAPGADNAHLRGCAVEHFDHVVHVAHDGRGAHVPKVVHVHVLRARARLRCLEREEAPLLRHKRGEVGRVGRARDIRHVIRVREHRVRVIRGCARARSVRCAVARGGAGWLPWESASGKQWTSGLKSTS
jgi:hypothetical protein